MWASLKNECRQARRKWSQNGPDATSQFIWIEGGRKAGEVNTGQTVPVESIVVCYSVIKVSLGAYLWVENWSEK